MANSLTQEEKLIFQDIADTGVLHTLKALSKLSGRDWSGFPRRFEILEAEQAARLFPQQEAARFCGDLYFDGETPFSLMCVFPQESAINLTHSLTDGKRTTADQSSLEILTVAEVSNILANTFLNVIANTIKMRILPTAPRVLVGSRGYLLNKAMARANLRAEYILSNDLRLESQNLSMSVNFCLLFETKSLQALIGRIHESQAWNSTNKRVF